MTVKLVGPDGQLYTLESDEPADLEAAQAQGFHVEGEKSPHDLAEETGQAAAAGVARGATFGLSDAALGQGGKEYGSRLRQLEEEHPIAHGVGELAGFVASPINKVGALVEGPEAATALARIGQKALGGGAVGALAGAGTTIGDAALQDNPQLTAEKLIAGAGLGMLLGATGSGVFGAIEEGAGAALSKLGSSRAQSTLEDFANDRWLKATGGIQNEIKKIPAAEHGAVADVIREHLTEPGKVLPKSLDDALASLEGERGAVGANVIKEAGITDAGGLAPHLERDDALAALEKATDAHGKRMGAVMDEADKLGAAPDYTRALGRLDAFEAGLNPAERDIIEKPLNDLRRYLEELGTDPAPSKRTFAKLNALKSTIQRDTNWVADGPAKFGLKRQLAGILRDEIDTQLAPQIGSKLAGEWQAAKAEFGALSRAEDALGRKASTGIDAIRALAENASTAPPSLARLSALEYARNLLKRGIDRKLGNRWLSASDYLTGIAAGVMHGNPLGALTGLATSIGHKFMREQGAAVVARLADAIAKSPALSATAASFSKSVPALASRVGPYGAQLAEAVARGPAVALATHMTLAQVDPGYAAHAQLAGLTPEAPEEHEAALTRAGQVAALSATAKSTDEAIDRHVEHVIKGTRAPSSTAKVLDSQDFGAKRMRREAADGHDQRTEEIRQLAGNPDALLERVSKNLEKVGPVAPGVAAALTAQANTAVQYLAKAAERPVKPGPLARDWVPTEAERHEFTQKLQVVQEPMSVLKHAAAGTLTQAQVDTLRTVYPGLAQAVADKALDRVLAAKPSEVPYRQRLMLSMLTGVDLDGTTSSAAIASNQLANRGTKNQENAAPQSSGARSEMTLASRMAMPQQRRELESE